MRALLATAPVALVLLTGLGSTGVALADDVVVPPLIPRGSTQVRDVANITQLISSELDFMSDVTKVVELSKVPAGFGVSCLDSASCLRGIGRKNEVDHVLAGTLRVSDAVVTIDLVYFDVTRGRFVRRKDFELVNRPEIIADNMDDVVREMVTGQAPKSVAEGGSDELDLLDFEDDFEVEFDKDDFAEAAADEEARRRQALEDERRAKELARKRAEEDARKRAEEERRAAAAAEERRRAEEEARRVAAAEARRKAEAEARAAEEAERRRAAQAEEERIAAARRRAQEREAQERAEAAAADVEEEFDPSMISFGSAEIQVEGSEPATVVEDDPEPVVTRRPMSTPSYYEEPDEEPEVRRAPAVVDLDADDEADERRSRSVRPVGDKRDKTARSSKSSSRSSSSSKSRSGGIDDDPTSVQIALRGGYSPYYNLGFVTVGGEASIALGDSGVHVLAGVQGWSVQREIPVQFQRQVGAATEWNTIVPYNAGVVYKATVADGHLRPYGGADLITARYYLPESGGMGSFAVGARARVGADIMIARAVGLNLDVAVGGWSGKNWDQIDLGVKNAGLLPQFSAGTVFAF